MLPLVLSIAALAPSQPAGHETLNPLYTSLLDPGLAVGGGNRVKLPTPAMPDGLDAAGQKAAIERVIGSDYRYADFTRKSVVAPQFLSITDADQPSDPNAPARRVDVYFIAYGDFEATEDKEFLDRLLSAGRGTGEGKDIPADELAERGIALDPMAKDREGYGQVEFDFLDKVRLKLTGRALWSKTGESVVAAAVVDERFRGDPEFPNEWRSLGREGGKVTAGEPQVYGGAGMYLKITKLAAPAGAVFVEQHVVFAEPTGWFDGANLLRSKLPIAVQDNVRSMRRVWLKGK